MRRVHSSLWCHLKHDLREPQVLWPLSAALVALALSALLTALAPLALKVAVDAGLTLETANASGRTLMIWAIVAYAATQAFSRLAHETQYYFFGIVEQCVHSILRTHLVDRWISASPLYHLDHAPSATLQRINNATRGASVLLQSFILGLLPVVIQLGATVAILATVISLEFAMIVAVAAASYMLVYRYGMGRVSEENKVAVSSTTALSASVSDALSNAETTKALSIERYILRGIQTRIATTAGSWRHFYARRFGLGLAITAVFAGTLSAAMGMAIHEFSNGRLTTGDFVLIASYLVQVIRPLEMIGWLHRDLSQAQALLTDAATALDELSEVSTTRRVRSTEPASLIKAPSLAAEHVCFGYSSRPELLQDVSLDAAPGELIGIVGESGSGKSTLLKVLAGLYAPTQGRVCIEDRVVHQINGEDKASLLAMLPQDVALYDDTIRANIRLGAEGSDERLFRSIRDAGLASLISRLPDGLDTNVGPRGAKLSMGERQRVGLARLHFRQVPVLLFDEATASLDAATEELVVKAIRSSMAERTRIVVAHRLATIMDAGRIYVMESGKIVEVGTHLELLERDGVYAGLWNTQFHSVTSNQSVAAGG